MVRYSQSFNLSFTHDKLKKSVTFRNDTYVFKHPQSDGSGVYRCSVRGCTSNIRINRNKTKILGGTYNHDHTSLNTSTSSRLSLVSKPDDVQSKAPDKGGRELTCDLSQTSIQPPPQLPSPSTDSTSETNTRVSTISPASPLAVPTEQHSIVPESHDAPHVSNQDTSSCVVIESTPCPKTSDPCEVTEKSVGTLKSQIGELKILRDTLIDQIMEKEKIIINQGDTINSLKKEVTKLEMELNKKKTPKKSRRAKGDNKDGNKECIDIDISQEESNFNFTTAGTNNKTSQHQTNENNVNKIRNCSLLGDSHCRGLGYYLRRYLDNVETFFKPGGGFIELKDSCTFAMSQLSPEDKVIFFCGTNNIQDRDWSKVFSAVDEVLAKYNACNLCFVLVPIRWDRPDLNRLVQKFNNRLREKLKEKKISYLDPNYFLRPWHYAKDGLHLNINGKRLVSLKLKYYLGKASMFCDQPIPEQFTGSKVNSVIDNNCSSIDSRVSNDVPTCSKYSGSNQTPSSSFAHDQTYVYDLDHLALMSNLSSSLCVTPNIMTRPIPVLDTSVINVSSRDSTFSFSPNFYTNRRGTKPI
uniref:Uncharacterized protein n=1 Tax=Cacopsylla melanoneura TaxID=428564 RepID=A0A8D9EVV7_9HEMI